MADDSDILGLHQAMPTMFKAPLILGGPFTEYNFDFTHTDATLGEHDRVASVLPMNAENWAILRRVNAEVNAKTTYQEEPKGRDLWTEVSKENFKGDCEDYALEKRKELIEAGIPAGAVRMALVSARDDWNVITNHAVLVVRTDKGDMVLNNFKIPGDDQIKHWQDSGLSFVGMQGSTDISDFRQVISTQINSGTAEHGEALRYEVSQHGGVSVSHMRMSVPAGRDLLLAFGTQAPANVNEQAANANACDVKRDVTIDRYTTQRLAPLSAELTVTVSGTDAKGKPVQVALPSLYTDDVSHAIYIPKDGAAQAVPYLNTLTGNWTLPHNKEGQAMRHSLESVSDGFAKLGITCEQPVIQKSGKHTIKTILSATNLGETVVGVKEQIDALPAPLPVAASKSDEPGPSR